MNVPALRIAEPAAGAVVALDPDIPPANQRLRFVAAGAAPGAPLRWRLDGKLVGRRPVHAWPPWPGRHQLQLEDASGRVLDAVRFEVRGAGVFTPGVATPGVATPGASTPGVSTLGVP